MASMSNPLEGSWVATVLESRPSLISSVGSLFEGETATEYTGGASAAIVNTAGVPVPQAASRSSLPPLEASEARPVLMAFIFRHFSERRKHAEVTLSCLLQIWKGVTSQAKWRTNVKTNLSMLDTEVEMPPVADSNTSAASFACIEQLGVAPPPSGGWEPLPVRGDGSPKAAEWLRTPANADWIYHTTEDRYFHLPTSTLWEQREVHCCDPRAPKHTYCRADALHLQVLFQFARSVDSAVMPMVWGAWVRYARKRAASRAAMKARQEQQAAAGPAEQIGAGPAGLACREGSVISVAATESVATTTVPVGADDSRASAGRAAGTWRDDRKSTAPPGGLAMLPEITDAADDRKAATGISKPPRTRGRRTCGSCLCLRSRRGSWERGSSDSSPSDRSSQGTPLKPGQKSAGGSSRGSGNATSNQSTAASPKPRSRSAHVEGSKAADCAEKQTRRIDAFLADVRKNPQKLVNHVSDRRVGRIHAPFVAGA